jgi:hypothetical protein
LTYRELLTAFAEAHIRRKELSDLEASYPHSGTWQERDDHQAKIDAANKDLDEEIPGE